MDKVKLVKLVLVMRLRRRLARKSRSCYIRPLFFNRNDQGDSLLIRELQSDPHYHFIYFRMDKPNFDYILGKLEKRLSHPKNHIRPISPIERLAVTLRYLSTGNSQISLALNFRISPASICLIIRETLTAIIDIMGPDFLPTPNKQTWIQNELGFKNNWQFPNACCSIDGKHIRIKSPAGSGSAFYNYKGYFSIVLFAISNAEYQFSAVDIGAYGSDSDGGVLMKSEIGKQLSNKTLGLPAPQPISDTSEPLPHVILGDDAFQLKPFMMRPFKGDYLPKDQRILNYRLSRARMTVENSFGILSARFRIFHSIFEADVELAKSITHASIILHNFLLKQGDFNSITLDRIEEEAVSNGNWRQETSFEVGINNIGRQGSTNYSKNAAKVRDEFKTYFMSEKGALSWPEKHVDAGC